MSQTLLIPHTLEDRVCALQESEEVREFEASERVCGLYESERECRLHGLLSLCCSLCVLHDLLSVCVAVCVDGMTLSHCLLHEFLSLSIA